MSSTLEQLNTYSSTTITYTDNRPEGVRFNYPNARDITIQIDSQVTQIQRSIDIVEIINPTLANVVVEIDVSAVSGATVQWSSIPSGVNVVNGNTYTIYNIDSVSDWTAMMAGNIVLPATFFGSFFYTCTVYYTDNGIRKNVNWQVGIFLPEAFLVNESSLTCTGKRLRGTEIDLLSTSGLLQFFFDAQFVNRFNLDVLTIAYNFVDAEISSSFDFDLFQPLNNLSNRTYLSNVSNLIFETNSPFIRDNNPGDANFEIDFTVSNGVLSQDNGATTSSSIKLFDDFTTVNNLLPNIIYYPDYNFSGTVTLDYSIEKDNVLLDSGKVFIENAGTGTISTNTYTFTSSNSGFKIPYEEVEYGKWEYLIVAGGGGGSAGGGGAGGQVLKGTNTILSHSSSFPISVGNGGSRGNYSFNWLQGGGGWTQNGGTGGNSSAIGLTAFGGQGGRSSSNSNYTVWNFNGGDTRTTANLTSSGGAGAPTPSGSIDHTYMIGAGGGGAGAGQAGSAAPLRGFDNGDPDYPIYDGGNGGNGVTSSITGVSIYYGGGGGGGPGYQGLGNDEGLGGLGGGGDASNNTQGTPAENGVDTLGGGGGGGSNDYIFGPDTWKAPGRGGSGIVILKVIPK